RDRLSQMRAYVPFGKELERAPQELFIIRRQYALARRELPTDDRIERVTEELVRIRVVECLQICRCTEVREQQKAAIEILGEHRGRVDARLREKRSDTDERRTALAGRRRTHHDQGQRVAAWRRRRCERRPQISPTAGVHG